MKINKNANSVSFCRYLLIIGTNKKRSVFTHDQYEHMQYLIIKYFKRKEIISKVQIISYKVNNNYIELELQIIPSVHLSKLINSLKTVLSRKFFSEFKNIREIMNGKLWDRHYGLYTKEYDLKGYIQEYINDHILNS